MNFEEPKGCNTTIYKSEFAQFSDTEDFDSDEEMGYTNQKELATIPDDSDEEEEEPSGYKIK